MAENSIVDLGVVDSKFAVKVDELEKDWTQVIETSVLLAEKQLLFAKRVKALWVEAEKIDAKQTEIPIESPDFFNQYKNNNLKTAISGLKPQYTIGNELIYKYNTETTFWGGNEYLYFENKDVRASNIGVQFIDLKEIYHGYLFTGISRKNSPYTYNPDINGNFEITAIDRTDVDVEADYTMIHFSLLHDELKGKDIHVYGNFNAFAIEEFTKMEFNPESKHYECLLKLKQGFYNYKYVAVDKTTGALDEGAISGDFWQTENNYKVMVYYRDLGARFDRLIGFGEASSIDISN